MTDPVSLTAGAIATLAFQEFIKAGAGEAAKKFTSEAIAKMGELREKIVARFKGHETIEAELVKAETGDEDAIASLGDYLSIEMRKAPEFANEIQQLANEINQCLIEDNSGQVQVNYGGTNFQNKVDGGKVYQAETINITEQ